MPDKKEGKIPCNRNTAIFNIWRKRISIGDNVYVVLLANARNQTVKGRVDNIDLKKCTVTITDPGGSSIIPISGIDYVEVLRRELEEEARAAAVAAAREASEAGATRTKVIEEAAKAAARAVVEELIEKVARAAAKEIERAAICKNNKNLNPYKVDCNNAILGVWEAVKEGDAIYTNLTACDNFEAIVTEINWKYCFAALSTASGITYAPLTDFTFVKIVCPKRKLKSGKSNTRSSKTSRSSKTD